MTEDTVIGVAIEPREPAPRRRSQWPRDERGQRMSVVRLMLECGPFLAAFDAGIDEVQV